jgi:hypothetical protein
MSQLILPRSTTGASGWNVSNPDPIRRVSPIPAPQSTQIQIDSRISQNRYRQLKEAFVKIDKDRSGKISLQEILNFLRYISDEVDEVYVTEIFNRLDRNRDGEVSIDEFIDGFLEQVNTLSEAATNIRQNLHAAQREKAEMEAELLRARHTEKINNFGIMEGSQLNLTVIEAQGLRGLGGKPRAYVIMMCERQRSQTNPAEPSYEPVWNESFGFNITMGNGDILITVHAQNNLANDAFLGQCSIDIQSLIDQVRRERWLTLDGGPSSNSRILLGLQWIHSKTLYLENMINSLSETVINESAELTRVESELRKLGTSPLGMFTKETWLDRLENSLMYEVDSAFSKYVGNLITEWKLFLRALLLIGLIISSLACFASSEFWTLVWLTCIAGYEFSEWSQAEYRVCVFSWFWVIIIDIISKVIFSEYLFIERREDDIETGIKKFSYLMCLLNLPLMILLQAVLIKNYSEFRHQETRRLLGQ